MAVARTGFVFFVAVEVIRVPLVLGGDEIVLERSRAAGCSVVRLTFGRYARKLTESFVLILFGIFSRRDQRRAVVQLGGQVTMREHPEQPPFQAHRRYYVFVKFAVLALAVLVALNLFGVL